MIYRMSLPTTQEKMREYSLKWLLNPDEKQIVELGCNDGNFAALMKRQGHINNYVGIDIQPEKVKKAKEKFPKMKFIVCDILQNLELLDSATAFVSFQSLEHIQDDLIILERLKPGCKVIVSVPNSEYKGHIRWFELDGWEERFSKFVDIIETVTIQNPKKHNKRSFLFYGKRKG